MQWPWQIPCAISPPSWVSDPVSVCYGLSVLILVWLLSFNPYTVLVAGQNLLGRCCSPRNQSSVNMVTTDNEKSLTFQCLWSIFWGQTKSWMNTPSSGSPTSLQCFTALSMSICNSQYLSRNSGVVNTGISELSLPSYGVWFLLWQSTQWLTHKLVWAKYVKLPLWKRVLTLSLLQFFCYLFVM